MNASKNNQLQEKQAWCSKVAKGVKRVSLKARLSILTLIVSIPLLIAITYLVTHIAASQMRQDADERLRLLNQKLAETAQIWLDFHVRTLTEIANHPDIISMNAERQKPHLERIGGIYKYVYLVSITDLQGKNVARSDDKPAADYHDRPWFQEARSGWTAFQSLLGRTGGEPALVVAMPIRDGGGNILGVCMFSGYLNELSRDVHSMRIGKTGFAFIVDAQNKVIAHPVAAYTAELRDIGNSPPIAALRQGREGAIAYIDADGVRWEAYVSALNNGWGIIVQQAQEEILSPLLTFRNISHIILASGAIVLLILSVILIRRALQPVSQLTETAKAIASGDLARRATVEHEDEIGLLSRAFNRMAGKLQGIIHRQQDQAKRLEETNTLLQGEIASRKLIEAQLRDLAEVDPLTGVPNRRKLLMVLDSEMKKVERYRQPLSLILFDIDHFKAVNDRYGHDVGDIALKTATDIVSRTVRDVDLLSRYGGEEFVVVCPGTQLDGARVLAEKIRQAIEKHDFKTVGHITVSLGVAEFRSGDDANAFIKRSDEALYRAKSKGRNRAELEVPR